MDADTLDYLKRFGVVIGFRAAEGDLLCRRIIRLYTMHRAWQSDKAAEGLLKESIAEYQRRVERKMHPSEFR